MKKGQNPLEFLVERCMNLLQQGVIPWRKTWKTSELPQNLVNRNTYRGVNMWHMMMLMMQMKWEKPFFLTKSQALVKWGYKYVKGTGWVWDRKKTPEPVELDLLGKGLVKKGEKSNIVVYWKWFSFKEKDSNGNETGRKKTFPKVFFYWVYNVAQLNLPEGAVPELEDEKVWTEADQVESAERVISEYVGVGNGGPKYAEVRQDRAYYRPTTDEVVVPLRTQFGKMAEFYSTAFHELVHSTGHKTRLNRKEVTDPVFFGSHDYSMEELVAEMGASLLSSECGFQSEVVENSAAYLAAWMKKLSQDKSLLWKAAQKAQKGVDLILGRKFEGDKEADGSEAATA